MTDILDVEERVKAGRTFRMDMLELASAGYLWSVENEDGLVFEKESWGADHTGTGGALTATFRAVAEKPGAYKINFIYKRPWEKEAQTIIRCALTVKP